MFFRPLYLSFSLSLSLSLCALCAIIQIYAKYKTLLATFWHPLDLALSIRLVELICFDCPRRPRLPLPLCCSLLLVPACLHYYLSNQLSTQSAITSCHLPLPLTIPLSLSPPLWFCVRSAFCGSRFAGAMSSSSGCHCDRLLSSGKGKLFSTSN